MAKPITNDFAQAVELVDLARAKGVTLSVGQQIRYNRHYAAVAEYVHSGALGSVEAAWTTIDLWVPAQGYLEALDASPVAVPRVPTGALKVKELVPEGSIVEAGEIVVVFDDTQLSIELDNHRATFRSAGGR